MPTFTYADPLSAAAETAGDYLQAKNAARDKAAELARASEQEQYNRGVQQKQLGFEEKRVALEQQQTESTIQHNNLQDQIAQAEEETRRHLAPILAQEHELAAKLAAKQITGAEYQNQAAALGLQHAKFVDGLDKKYGEENAKIAVQQALANLNQTKAQTGYYGAEEARADAEAAKARKETEFVGTSLGGRGGAADAAYEQAVDAISKSPAATKFYNMVFTGNKPMTKAEAMLALSRSALMPADKQALQTIFTNKNSSFITRTGELTGARAEANAEQKPRLREFQVLKGNPGFQALPSDEQVLLEQSVEAYGYDDAIKHIKAIAAGGKGAISPEVATSILGTLGVK